MDLLLPIIALVVSVSVMAWVFFHADDFEMARREWIVRRGQGRDES